MATEQVTGASAEEADRAATPSEPSPAVSGKAGIPCAKKRFPEVRQEYHKRGQPGQVFAIMCEGGGLPTVLHGTFNGAAHEAARLAHDNPGQRFHVLASQRVSFAPTAGDKIITGLREALAHSRGVLTAKEHRVEGQSA